MSRPLQIQHTIIIPIRIIPPADANAITVIIKAHLPPPPVSFHNLLGGSLWFLEPGYNGLYSKPLLAVLSAPKNPFGCSTGHLPGHPQGSCHVLDVSMRLIDLPGKLA